MDNKQTLAWATQFGEDYTKRNEMTLDEMNEMYLKRYGITRSDMNKEFIDGLNREIRILEVGSNIGLQLQFLQSLGFKYLYGIEISDYAVELSKQKTKGINIIKGDVFDIPFKDGYFDLVFTSGVLIHINPLGLKFAMQEICRVTNRFIWGFEYYSDRKVQINYRGENELLWKDDFVRLYYQDFSLKLVKQRMYPLKSEDNTDTMFLLEKC